jgi:hypothetical protein
MTRVAAVLKSDPRFDPRKRTLFAASHVTLFTRVNACFFRVTACFFRWGQISRALLPKRFLGPFLISLMQESTPGANFGTVESDFRAKRCICAGHLRVKYLTRVNAPISECTRVMTRVLAVFRSVRGSVHGSGKTPRVAGRRGWVTPRVKTLARPLLKKVLCPLLKKAPVPLLKKALCPKPRAAENGTVDKGRVCVLWLFG